jgi:predicted ATP-grasp superfamily ATP-dependent carboligase
MHIFLYEWITGGGLVEQPGRLPASLLTEGSAMIAALADDFAAMRDARVTVLRDMRIDMLPLRGCEVVEIESSSQRNAEFDRLTAAADRTMVVAPEFDGILLDAVERIGSAGGRSLNASAGFVRICANKHNTAERLAASGVPVPVARFLDADEAKLPADFEYPAVLKPIDGAGSQHTLLVHDALDEPPPYPWPRRLERYCPGRAASVAVLAGPNGRHALPPCWQHLSDDGRFAYRGGAIVGESALAGRAAALANRALDALPPALGYVGIDLVLGNDPDGREDFVIEVNPRLTTSYVGLRAAIPQNLAKAILDVADGRNVELTPGGWEMEFDASGAVWRPRAPSSAGRSNS